MVYRATPGLANDSYVNWGNGTVEKPPTFTGDDYWNHVVAIDPSCGPNPYVTGYPSCADGGLTPAIEVFLGDGDDHGTAGNSVGIGHVVEQYGEGGDDTLKGTHTTDHLYGGPGNDMLTPDGTGVLGTTAVSNGDVVSGGEGVDTLKTHDYGSPGIRITLDGVADDGEIAADGVGTQEGDNYLPDIENVIGPTSTSAVVVATAAANTITTGMYADVITPGAGADTVSAGAGDDTIHARDGVADHIDCGTGTDTVVADRVDTLIGCENVDLGHPGARSRATVTKAKLRANRARTRLTLPLSCSRGTTRCRGAVRLVSGRGRKAALLGKGSYNLAPGARARTTVKLTKAARKLLRRRSTVRAIVVLKAKVGRGATRRVTLVRR